MVDEGVSSPANVRQLVADDVVPFGFAVRRTSPDATALWHSVTPLDEDRFALAVGYCPDTAGLPALRARIVSALRAGGDPAAALSGMRPEDGGAACAVIDRTAAALSYSALGDAVVVLAAPDQPGRMLRPATTGRVDIPAGATVALRAGVARDLDGYLADSACAAAHPDVAVGRLVDHLAPHAEPGLVVLLYRQAPSPLEVTLPADPRSLAQLRARLRPWLALAGVDAEPAADVLLAIGEAASNSTEHAVIGAARPVELTVRTALAGDRLRMTVTDNGTWKPAAACPGHRGHGIKLITALVDSSDLTTSENGTTVDMLKELRR